MMRRGVKRLRRKNSMDSGKRREMDDGMEAWNWDGRRRLEEFSRPERNIMVRFSIRFYLLKSSGSNGKLRVS